MGLDQALRSNFWVVVLSMLGGAAYFGAQGVGHLVAAGKVVRLNLHEWAVVDPLERPSIQ